jgi:hypothetical protein
VADVAPTMAAASAVAVARPRVRARLSFTGVPSEGVGTDSSIKDAWL